mgnify:CR=1 FL=1
MAVLDTAKALFKARPRLCMDMPEWGNGEDGKPFRVYYRTR